jgi:D-arabinose 1-dehydrogenase-like Zn-dependent alcohol dehydrogenase
LVTEPELPELVDLEVLATQPSGALVGRASTGALVVACAFDACGQCEICRRGGAAVCPTPRARERGARVRVMHRWAVELTGGLELPVPHAAAVAGDVALAYTLYARTGLGPRDPLAITGATAVTRFLVEIVVAKGLTPIVVTPNQGNAEWASWLASKRAVPTALDGVNAALVAQGLGARPLRVIATGDAELAFELAGPRATLTLLAPSPAIPAALAAREVTIIGVAGPHPDLVTEAAAMCVRGEIDLAGGVGDGPTQARVAITTRA